MFRLGHSISEISKALSKSREGVRIQLEMAGVLPAANAKTGCAESQVIRGKVRWNSPYGFRYERGRPVRHPQEYETFLVILKLRDSGQNAREIADHLNEQKLRPRTARRWDRCTVHRILEWHQSRPEFLKEVLTWESENSSK
ncbi:MAG TPA: hypothetical protein DCS07_09265 [Bdellovibrionales bacterium]|nr:MAG: hypothetical protein A2X97_12415 [Bdellovibrionales bacterium GWA1_52_35]HAR42799.1 hypothetical protein [Bdellovibrionales bacterium]HCM41650.1 hypothetical protein [Bdellovibrionales bacterium]